MTDGVSEDGTDDRQWTITTSGTYDVTVDLSASTISIRLAQEEPRDMLGEYRSWSPRW